MTDRLPEQNEHRKTPGIATLDNSGYTLSRLGLVPHVEDDPPPSASFKPSPPPATPAIHSPPPQPAIPPAPAWRESSTERKEPVCRVEEEEFDVPEPARATEEEFVRVTVKVPRALRDILRSCAKSTRQYQYVLVIEALAEFLVHLPEDMQRQLLRDVNGETPKQVHADVPTSTWKRIWKRWFGR